MTETQHGSHHHDHSAPATSAEAAALLAHHHAHMIEELDRLSQAVCDATPPMRGAARTVLDRWIDAVLLPHAAGEETSTYAAAHALGQGRALIDSMVAEHVLIKALVASFRGADEWSAGAWARALFMVFDSHQRKENDIVVPLLLDAGTDLAAIVAAEHESSAA